MKQQKEMITMLLAGGQGTRLYVLTKEVAKPAVPFGGKYRIIDFPLSNCVNSGIDTVGILTQYQPLELNEYIGNGQPWNLNKTHSCAQVLPPYERHDKKSGWYKGTANAIYQNIDFIDRYDPDYVVILSGDHIYKMDYAAMVEYHEKHQASCTIAVRNVPLAEASRFGILNTNPDMSIYEFEEKPARPKSTNASMGIYVFNWQVLKKALTEDEEDPKSSNDFGKNIIPKLLNQGHKMMAYPFDGYWKDVGTIDSLWEANMDLLNPKVNINLSGDQWRIYARNEPHPPHFIREKADIAESLITEGCDINGKLWYTVLFSGVTVEEGAELNSAVVMKNTVIKKGAIVKYAIIAEDAVIEEGAVVGDDPCNYSDPSEWGIAVVGRGAVVKKGQVVRPKEMIEPDANR